MILKRLITILVFIWNGTDLILGYDLFLGIENQYYFNKQVIKVHIKFYPGVEIPSGVF